MNEEELIYVRDLDGTGSLHACSKGDPGAIEYLPATRLQSLIKERDALACKLRDANNGLVAVVAAAGGDVSIPRSVLEDLPRMELVKEYHPHDMTLRYTTKGRASE